MMKNETGSNLMKYTDRATNSAIAYEGTISRSCIQEV